jgi:hypothetical protein
MFFKTFIAFRNWLTTEGRVYIIATIFYISQVAYFIVSYVSLMNDNSLSTFKKMFGESLGIARGLSIF